MHVWNKMASSVKWQRSIDLQVAEWKTVGKGNVSAVMIIVDFDLFKRKRENFRN